MSFFVYIIYSESKDKYYVGYTANIEERLEKHNLGATPSTRHGIPWELVYSEEFPTKKLAITRENQIKKKKSRSYIEYLVSKNQPD